MSQEPLSRRNNDQEWFEAMREHRLLLAKPLPGGKGFQRKHYEAIQRSCARIAVLKPPRVP